MPVIEDADVQWAMRIVDVLAIGGTWTVPGVGVYEKTGEAEINLSEIHSARPIPDALGFTLFDKHEWLVMLFESMGWKITEEVLIVQDEYGESFAIPEDKIGDVGVCESGCGSLVRVEPASAGRLFIKIKKGDMSYVNGLKGICPVCGESSINEEFIGLHVVVDDTGARMKREARQEEEEE
jgi:hypothetical protein